MKNKAQRAEDERDRKDPLFLFLGGDYLALKIFRALLRVGIGDEGRLRERFRDGDSDAFVGDPVQGTRGIGTVALARIAEKLKGSG